MVLQWVLEDKILFKNVDRYRDQQRLTYEEFADLGVEFGRTDSSFRTAHEEALLSVPLKSWVAKLKEI